MADPKPTPQAEANTDQDSSGSGTSLADVAAALRAAFTYGGGGFNFDSDVNMVEALKFYSGLVAASATTSKVASDFATNQMYLAASAAHSLDVNSNAMANAFKKFDTLDQGNLAQDRKWNVDEVSGYAVMNTSAVAEVVKSAVRQGIVEAMQAFSKAQDSES